jgi:hypothetical protein
MTHAPIINANLVSSQAFEVHASGTGRTTYTRGTIFITGDQKHPNIRHVQIIAWARVDPQVDPDDYEEGIQFNLPKEWEVTAIVTDFAKDNSHQYNYVHWEKANALYIIIGENLKGVEFPLSTGGQGNIRIDLELSDTSTPLPENLNFDVFARTSSVEYSIPFNAKATTTTSISTGTSITK